MQFPYNIQKYFDDGELTPRYYEFWTALNQTHENLLLHFHLGTGENIAIDMCIANNIGSTIIYLNSSRNTYVSDRLSKRFPSLPIQSQKITKFNDSGVYLLYFHDILHYITSFQIPSDSLIILDDFSSFCSSSKINNLIYYFHHLGIRCIGFSVSPNPSLSTLLRAKAINLPPVQLNIQYYQTNACTDNINDIENNKNDNEAIENNPPNTSNPLNSTNKLNPLNTFNNTNNENNANNANNTTIVDSHVSRDQMATNVANIRNEDEFFEDQLDLLLLILKTYLPNQKVIIYSNNKKRSDQTASAIRKAYPTLSTSLPDNVLPQFSPGIRSTIGSSVVSLTSTVCDREMVLLKRFLDDKLINVICTSIITFIPPKETVIVVQNSSIHGSISPRLYSYLIEIGQPFIYMDSTISKHMLQDAINGSKEIYIPGSKEFFFWIKNNNDPFLLDSPDFDQNPALNIYNDELDEMPSQVANVNTLRVESNNNKDNDEGEINDELNKRREEMSESFLVYIIYLVSLKLPKTTIKMSQLKEDFSKALFDETVTFEKGIKSAFKNGLITLEKINELDISPNENEIENDIHFNEGDDFQVEITKMGEIAALEFLSGEMIVYLDHLEAPQNLREAFVLLCSIPGISIPSTTDDIEKLDLLNTDPYIPFPFHLIDSEPNIEGNSEPNIERNSENNIEKNSEPNIEINSENKRRENVIEVTTDHNETRKIVTGLMFTDTEKTALILQMYITYGSLPFAIYNEEFRKGFSLRKKVSKGLARIFQMKNRFKGTLTMLNLSRIINLKLWESQSPKILAQLPGVGRVFSANMFSAGLSLKGLFKSGNPEIFIKPVIKTKKADSITRFIISSPFYTIKVYIDKPELRKPDLNILDEEASSKLGYVVEVENIGGSDCNFIDRGCWVIVGNKSTDELLFFQSFQSGAFSAKEKKIFRVDKGYQSENPKEIECWVLDKGLLGIDESCHISSFP